MRLIPQNVSQLSLLLVQDRSVTTLGSPCKDLVQVTFQEHLSRLRSKSSSTDSDVRESSVNACEVSEDTVVGENGVDDVGLCDEGRRDHGDYVTL